jgi:metal-responsive CopG/Arc/MetJ family transcriptional regulator
MPKEESLPVMVRLSPNLAKLVDDWRRKKEDLPGRPEAIRRLIEQALKSKKT